MIPAISSKKTKLRESVTVRLPNSIRKNIVSVSARSVLTVMRCLILSE